MVVLAGCVDQNFHTLGRELPCAIPSAGAAPADVVVVLRAPVGNRWLTECSGVALSSRLIATHLKCVLARSEPAPTEVAEEAAPILLPAESRTSRSGSVDLASACQADAGWTSIEDGDFSGVPAAPLEARTIVVSKLAGSSSPVSVTRIFAMPASTYCRDTLALLELEADLDVSPVAIRFGDPPIVGDPLVLGGFCTDSGTSTLIRREFPSTVEGVSGVTATALAPPHALLVSNSVAGYAAGGGAFSIDTNALVGLIMSGTLFPDCTPFEDGPTYVLSLAPYRRMLLDAAAEVGATLYSEFDPELGTELCPQPVSMAASGG